ncbi:uncharacterized protein [Palaemon carinicauda]|uniref:uncharacterized protein n=1 Tax=Palaemon carinicauda TaxID=392227 RepID=UPI0035B5BC93
MRDTRPRAVPAPAPTRSPTRPRVATAHRVAQEAPKTLERPLAARPARPPQQRTPVRPHRDARPQASVPVLLDQRQPSRDPAPALTRPQPVLPDTRSGATVISRPSGPRQVAAHPCVRPPPAPAPDRRMPTPSPTRSRGHVPAPAAARHRS